MRLDGDRVTFGIEIPLSSFEELAAAHMAKVGGTMDLEKFGSSLVTNDFPLESTVEFVKRVCSWGGYSGVWGRVLKQNDGMAIQAALRDAMAALGSAEPNVELALGSVNRLRGLGKPSFASKHLRFLRPQLCPVFDAIVSGVVPYPYTRRGYMMWADDCVLLAERLARDGVANPWRRATSGWLAADVEAAIFQWVRSGGRQVAG